MTQPRCVFKSRLFRLHLPLIFNKAVNVSLNKQVKFIRIYSCTEIWWYHVRPHGDLQSRGQIVAGEISAHVQWGLNKHHSEKSVVVLWGYWPELLETAVSQLALGFQCRRVLLHIWSSRKGCLISYLPCKASLSYEKKSLFAAHSILSPWWNWEETFLLSAYDHCMPLRSFSFTPALSCCINSLLPSSLLIFYSKKT